MSRKIESLDIYEAKQIHEVDPLSSLTGREEILIDNGTLTFKATIDGLLGYFASRFVGNQDNEIDISALNSASCIHIIPPGKDIPVQERIKNHFYLKLDEAEIDAFYSALLQGHDESRYFLKTSKNNVEGLLYPDHYYINDHYYKYLKILTIEITNNEDPVYINETFDLNLVNQISDGYSSTIFNKVHFECLHTSGQYIENSIVIYCTDYMDEFVLQTIGTYENKKFVNIASSNVDTSTDKEKEDLKKKNEDLKDMLNVMKEAIGDVCEVKLTNRIKKHPVTLSSTGDITIEMEKVINAMPTDEHLNAKKILEINENHKIVDKLNELYQNDQETLKKYAKILYAQARLIEGLPIDNPAELSNLVTDALIGSRISSGE